MNYEKYSVLMSVYKNDDPVYFSRAIDSMLNQTDPPDEIVLVRDGPLSDKLDETIADYRNKYFDVFSIVSSAENIGLGRALALGLHQCRNELVARMDSDDISDPDRCRRQLLFLSEHPECSVVGSNIAEFNGDIDDVVSYRNVPENHEHICEFMKKRCPMNHMTVMMKKSEVEKAGGYQHWFCDEDYFLWVRMYLQGCQFHNIRENLVFARIDQSTFKRRGGLKYYRSERDLFKYMYKHKIIGFFAYQKAKFIRFVVQILMPNSVRQWFFKKFARQTNETV